MGGLGGQSTRPSVSHPNLTVAQLVERGTVNAYSGDP